MAETTKVTTPPPADTSASTPTPGAPSTPPSSPSSAPSTPAKSDTDASAELIAKQLAEAAAEQQAEDAAAETTEQLQEAPDRTPKTGKTAGAQFNLYKLHRGKHRYQDENGDWVVVASGTPAAEEVPLTPAEFDRMRDRFTFVRKAD